MSVQNLRRIQPFVHLTENSKKLIYLKSPLKRAYPPNGINLEILNLNNHTKKEKILTSYRNVVRLVKYLQLTSHTKIVLRNVIKIKFLQDYGNRRKVHFTDLGDLKDNELFQRLINTINFIHNACLDNVNNENRDPISMEYKIIDSILQFENSKSNKALKSWVNIFSWSDFVNLRLVDKSWKFSNMPVVDSNQIHLKDENGFLDNKMCFGYVDEFKEKNKTKQRSINLDMLKTLLLFERNLILMNEDCKLLL